VSDLAGTSWQATGVNNGLGAVVSTASTEELTLAFGTDGTVTGYGGCSTFAGTYTATADQIDLVALPDDGCESAEQDQYLAALTAATTWLVDGNRLELRDDGGALQAGYTAQ